MVNSLLQGRIHLLLQEGFFVFPPLPAAVLEGEQESAAVSTLRFANLNLPGHFSVVIT